MVTKAKQAYKLNVFVDGGQVIICQENPAGKHDVIYLNPGDVDKVAGWMVKCKDRIEVKEKGQE